MKSGFLLLVCWLAAFSLMAQSSDARIAKSKTPLHQIERLVMPPLDNEALRQAELARRGPGIAPRFAESMAVQVSPQTHGSWETLSGGREVWRLHILSKGALSLNLGFNTFRMPEGGTLILYSPDREKVMGPFTPADNEEHEQLWTPVLDGDELVVEVQLPAEKRNELALMLTNVNHDFMGFSQMVASGSCNLDVVCGGADGWGIVDNYRDIIQSVAVYGFNGNTFCTGFLINNARNDCTPYFMTANHCGVNNGNAASLVVYWNYENSICRQPLTPQSGAGGDGSLDDFNSGAVFRAAYSPSDMTLVELDDPVSSTADAFFAGWTIADTAPQDSVICIHHPSTEEKRISFEFDATYRGSWGNGAGEVPTGNHIIVPDWDIGTTEGGSSGSPLFDRNKRVVGQLHGGAAFCGNDSYDSFGWFTTSWAGGGANNNRLSNWLDPDGTGITFLDGRYQMACSFFVEPDLVQQEICAPEDVVFTFSISANFVGDVALSAEGLPANLNAAFDVNPATPGGISTLTLSNTAAVATGTYTLTVNATDGVNNSTVQVQVTLSNGLPATPVLLTPENNATGVFPVSSLEWAALPGNIIYELELATDALFTEIVTQTVLANVSTLPVLLDPETIYFWRVRPESICGLGEWSEVFSFETAAIICASPVVATEPVNIPSQGAPTVTSSIEIETPGNIASIRLTGLDITHSWVGDLTATLTAP
ncbi:MAG: trypsin-like peptidase domain-containing protein, partial [Saprospiraceae bacterium]|nr:trypsin-like peptidase domain-containing protein [Saprospiraceae bacterium]